MNGVDVTALNTDGVGANAMLECVGSKLSTETALRVAAPEATVGRNSMATPCEASGGQRSNHRNNKKSSAGNSRVA
ncbi:hypothetical protein [Bifidobacterium gallicum]|uniref:Alcohol dehydrogenase n=1 Tax=Bifidobacterium gallicum DSM 20093 = LMG 11596 TaxID=561180 RepID=D1NW45_9BIFI|nr:hypothetical protein [Bifidobacterium gallicum]EFA22331.1 hypothetical protein BIFGAL_04090 [Bifidobacterium gallicum DSM 20093 = LMG 11596]KFI60046.1 alcohol dehydrogenase [Bifidobacterium gallicum DSM 20093 = LMG 11596]